MLGELTFFCRPATMLNRAHIYAVRTHICIKRVRLEILSRIIRRITYEFTERYPRSKADAVRVCTCQSIQQTLFSAFPTSWVGMEFIPLLKGNCVYGTSLLSEFPTLMWLTRALPARVVFLTYL